MTTTQTDAQMAQERIWITARVWSGEKAVAGGWCSLDLGYGDRCFVPADALDALQAERDTQAARIAQRDATIHDLLASLDDAINSPKGVVPASAEPFWDGQCGCTTLAPRETGGEG